MYPGVNHFEPLVAAGLGANESTDIPITSAVVQWEGGSISCADNLDAWGHLAQLLDRDRKYPILGPFWQRAVKSAAMHKAGPSMAKSSAYHGWRIDGSS